MNVLNQTIRFAAIIGLTVAAIAAVLMSLAAYDRRVLQIERPILFHPASEMQCTAPAGEMCILLAYPGGKTVTLTMGHGLGPRECQLASDRARLQLGQTLSVARLVYIGCTPERSA